MITFIEEKVIGSAVQDVDLDATLAGDTDKGYYMTCFIVNSAVTGNFHLRLNTLATVINQRQWLTASGLSVTAFRAADPVIGAIIAGDPTTITINIPKSDTGTARFLQVVESRRTSTALVHTCWEGPLTTPLPGTEEIVGIGLGCDAANGIGVGSVFRLWKWS
jgi:hypothetical protein